MMNFKKGDHGFTLVEVLVAVALLAIISAIAIPAWRSWKANSDLKSATYQVVSIIQWAQSEAAKQNACMGIKITVTGNAATPGGAITVFRDDDCDAYKDWPSALSDANDQCNANMAAGSIHRCLRRVSFNNTVSLFATQDDAFSINPRGLIRNGPAVPFRVQLRSTYNSNGYDLMISPASSVRVDSI